MRGGGTGRGRATRASRSASLTETPARRGEECLCGTCGDDVGANPIGCDKCDQWVHGSQMCSGLPQDLITAILKYDGGGIQFICMKCRMEQVTARSNSPSGNTDPQLAETVKQLHMQVKGMCSIIKELAAQVKALSSKPPSNAHDAAAITLAPPVALPQPPVPPPAQEEYRDLIREELREQKEREKRRSFLVVKGLTASSTTEFLTKFKQVARDCLETTVEPSEVMAIATQKNYFRVKILDDSCRKLILDRAKHLRGSEYQNVYISRDLTYAQRTELYRRRQERQAQVLQREGAPESGNEPHHHNSQASATTAAHRDSPPQLAGVPGQDGNAASSLGN